MHAVGISHGRLAYHDVVKYVMLHKRRKSSQATWPRPLRVFSMYGMWARSSFTRVASAWTWFTGSCPESVER